MSMGMKIQEVAESFLSPVSLRLTKEDERERFDQLLKTKHYLQSARIGGSHLRYFAEVGGDPDIQRRGPAFEASGKMGGLESQAAGSATGIRNPAICAKDLTSSLA